MTSLEADSEDPKRAAVNAVHRAGGIGVYAASKQGLAVVGTSVQGTGIVAHSEQYIAVEATAKKNTAVFATSDTGVGVNACSKTHAGVWGVSEEGVAVRAEAKKDTAVFATSDTGRGIDARSGQFIAVEATATKDTAVFAHSDTGIGVDARSTTTAVAASSEQGTGIYAKGGTYAGNFEGNVNVNGTLSVGNVSIANNVLLFAQRQTSYYTIGLNGDESSLSFAHPDDGHYTIILDGRNNKLSVGPVLIDGVAGDVILQGADCAEDFEVQPTGPVEPGTVMTLNDAGQLEQGTKPYDKRVAGVVSGAGGLKPGLVLGRRPRQTDRLPIALMGRVYCKVDASYAPIQVGDLITTSATPGHAMKASDPARSFGAVIGKALRPLESGRDLIPILVGLQ